MSSIIEKLWRGGIARHITDWIPDKIFLSITYKLRTGEKMDWTNPESFNQKLQWTKLCDRNPKYTDLVDKIRAKEIAGNMIGHEHIIRTIGVYDRFEDIDLQALPHSFVLKCTHDSGCTIVCKNKEEFDKKDAKKKLNTALNTDYYKYWREWPYKNVQRKIIVEEYKDDGTGQLKDYKIFCFDGEPCFIQVDYGRFTEHKRNLYDTEWKYIPVRFTYPNDPAEQIEKPEMLNQMLTFARILSKGMKFVRTDFYISDGEIYFGEFTLFPEGGYGRFDDKNFEQAVSNRFSLTSL